MKIFLSGLEAGGEFWDIDRCFKSYKWMLLSFYYLKQDIFEQIRDKSELILIDSGAHSFQKGKAVDWVKYTEQYAEWIQKNDCKKIVGYFEMDVDNIIGYDKVLELRKILESVSDKIIPVWHKNRGIDEYKKMCHDYAEKIIAVTGFKNADIKDEQYPMFLKYAKKYNCKVHCLGMTRKKMLNKVPFDYADSSSWKQQAIYGRVGEKKVSKEFSKQKRWAVMVASLRNAMDMQSYYYEKWRKVNKD